MKKDNQSLTRFLHVTAWIIFIGLCIKTGALLVSYLVGVFMGQTTVQHLYMGLNLSALYDYNQSLFHVLMLLILVLSGLKAWLFYQVIHIFLRINLQNPFSLAVGKLIEKIGYLALLIGIGTILTGSFVNGLKKEGAVIPDLEPVLGGGAEFLLFGAVIFMIAAIFKRGIELQTENDLTV